jgi:hypothetical protein
MEVTYKTDREKKTLSKRVLFSFYPEQAAAYKYLLDERVDVQSCVRRFIMDLEQVVKKQHGK